MSTICGCGTGKDVFGNVTALSSALDSFHIVFSGCRRTTSGHSLISFVWTRIAFSLRDVVEQPAVDSMFSGCNPRIRNETKNIHLAGVCGKLKQRSTQWCANMF